MSRLESQAFFLIFSRNTPALGTIAADLQNREIPRSKVDLPIGRPVQSSQNALIANTEEPMDLIAPKPQRHRPHHARQYDHVV